MTKRELIEAFLRGDVDRRQFVNRLTMLGVSGGAAVAYATSLGQSAAASPSQPAAGFVMRAQTEDDEDYGGAIDLPSDEEGIAIAIAVIQGVIALLESLDQFAAADFVEGALETLRRIQEQQTEHADALSATTGAARVVRQGFAAQTQTFASADELVNTVSDALEELAGVYAAIVPALKSAEYRQTVMGAASVAARHAAHTRSFAGRELLPEAFQEAALPEGAQ
jgi:hypothetical protein